MTVLTKIAEWLDPGRAETAAQLDNANTALEETRRTLELLQASNENLVNKLADAGAAVTKLRKNVGLLRTELTVARSYVLDASDELEDQLEKLPPKSKKREPLLATIAAVNSDLKNISDVMYATYEEGK